MRFLSERGITMLKRLTVFIIICGIAYSCYFDWKIGTLPAAASNQVNKVEENNNIQHVEVIVLNGETVLSIVEKVNNGNNIPSSMSKIIEDFETLNPNVKAHVIKAGIKYLFPIYKHSQE
jgi:hypothetical protein